MILAALLLAFGSLSGRFGRKGMLVAGLAVVGIASLADGFTTSPGQLIAARAVMGLGAAITFPATLSLISNVLIALVPVAAVAAVLVALAVPSSKDPPAAAVDIPGLVLSSAAMALLVFTIIEAPTTGGVAAVGALLAALFLPAHPARPASPPAGETGTAEGTHELQTRTQPAAAAHWAVTATS
jgi:MFS family permease